MISYFRNTLLAALLCTLSAAMGQAAVLSIPDTTVSATDVFSGPSFTVSGSFGSSDIVNVRGIGTIDLDYGDFTADAAGIIVFPSTTNTGNHPGEIALGPGGFPYASVLIGNGTLGFFPLFPADASTGLGSSTPPTTVTALNRTLGSIFGSNFAGLSNGAVLQLRINDINTAGNLRAFQISTVQAVVPEPGTVALLLAGGLTGASLLLRRRRK